MGFSAILCGLLVLVVFLTVWLKIPSHVYNYYRLCKLLRNLPSPTTLPKEHWLLGHIPAIYKQDEALVRSVLDFINRDGAKLFKLWIGPFPNVVIAHSEELSKLLKEPKSRLIYNNLLPWLGEGLLISEGKKWFRNRHLLTPAFHYEILKGYAPVYNECLAVLLEKWASCSAKGEPVALFDSLSLMSLDIIMQSAFSFKSNCQTAKSQLPYVKACSDLVHLCSNRGMNPIMAIDWVFYCTPLGKRTRELCDIVHRYAEEVIAKRRVAIESKTNCDGVNGLKERKNLDFLDILLMARDEEGKGMSDLEIRNEVDTFMFEGHDTTTSGMSWTLYCLAQHPQHQEKIREEVKRVLKGREFLEYEDLKSLSYTTWCIKEAMRLYPPVFYFFRKATTDVRVGNHVVPKGTVLIISPLVIHHNSNIWDNPEKFDPQRFEPGNMESHTPYDYIPFSAGSRNCIGQNFAMNEMRVVIGTVVNQFSLALDPSHAVEMVPRVVLRSKNDIKLVIQPILK